MGQKGDSARIMSFQSPNESNRNERGFPVIKSKFYKALEKELSIDIGTNSKGTHQNYRETVPLR